MTIYRLDILLFLFGTSLLFHVGRLKLDWKLRPLSFLLLLFSNFWLPRPQPGIYTEIPPISLAYFPSVLDYLRLLFSLLVFFSTDFQAAICSTLTFIKYWLTYFSWRIITLQYWSDFFAIHRLSLFKEQWQDWLLSDRSHPASPGQKPQ